MAGRANAATELTRFGLEVRHGCLVAESVPVPVPRGQSDLDLVAIRPTLAPLALPEGFPFGPRHAVESKDEHDREPSGKGLGKRLRADVARAGASPFVPRTSLGPVKFSMLRETQHEVAERLFGMADFNCLFVVHAVDTAALAEVRPILAAHRIAWLTLPSLVADLAAWYRICPRSSGLRHSLVGDLWHLPVGFCGLDLPANPKPPT